MKKFVVVFLMLIISQVSFAKDKTFILCTNEKDKSGAIITLDEFKKFNKSINCIRADFVVDISGCAPSDGYGLDPPVGEPVLGSVVDRWQDYRNHFGGITGCYIDDTTISFSSGFNFPDSGYEENWTFKVNRLTGKAKLEIKDSKPKVYSCEKISKKI